MANDDDEERSPFLDYLDHARSPREGYWSPFSVLAWIATRDNQAVAASQQFEQDNEANRGGIYSAAAWMMIGDGLADKFGTNLTQAEFDLREALEANRLAGGIATIAATGDVREIERHEWTKWDRTFEAVGLCLIPGMHNFKWPPEHVRAAFPGLSNDVAVGAESSVPDLPESAKPRHRKHKQYADEAAILVRQEQMTLEQAFCKVAPHDPTRQEQSIVRAIRDTFDILYDRHGQPLRR